MKEVMYVTRLFTTVQTCSQPNKELVGDVSSDNLLDSLPMHFGL